MGAGWGGYVGYDAENGGGCGVPRSESHNLVFEEVFAQFVVKFEE